MNTTYDEKFFAWVNLTAKRSAVALLPLAKEQVHLRSVLDVGCGQGAWLAVWSDLGLVDWMGIDGDHVNMEHLLIPRQRFRALDLRKSWDVGRRFDLVQSLEVAEHIPVEAAQDFIGCLCAHGDVVLFSAAQPGQGGVRHINERRPSYWAGLFAAHGYAAFDCIQPLVIHDRSIDPWYRFNTLLYANTAGVKRLSSYAKGTRIDRLADLDHRGDFQWHLRCALLRPLPESVVTLLSRLRYRLSVGLSRHSGDT
jgi:SAM-dependent methyltransferase